MVVSVLVEHLQKDMYVYKTVILTPLRVSFHAKYIRVFISLAKVNSIQTRRYE